MTGLAVSTRGLVHVYRTEGQDVAALAGVDLSILPGETVCLLGPSGSGKSTLLSLLGGLQRPGAGRIQVGAHSLTDLSDEELAHVRATEIGVVMQGGGTNLVPYLTGRENIEFARSAGRGRDTRSSVDDFLDLVGVQDAADRLPREMSPGEAQLVAVAVGMAGSPGLLLADEPTAALSHDARDRVLEAVSAVNRVTGVTVVAVAHDDAVARAMQRTITIRDGRVGGEGRDGREYAVVAADGSVPLPPAALDLLPPGTVVRIHQEESGWSIVPVETLDAESAEALGDRTDDRGEAS